MGMTVTEFITQLNKIIFDKSGITLVPEDQIVEVERKRLDINDKREICPYCQMSNQEELCQMHRKNRHSNNCLHNGSTYQQLRFWIKEKTFHRSIREFFRTNEKIIKLYKEYNEQFD